MNKIICQKAIHTNVTASWLLFIYLVISIVYIGLTLLVLLITLITIPRRKQNDAVSVQEEAMNDDSTRTANTA